jgi:hypothetical protein
MIVVVVITRDGDENLASSATVGRIAENRTRHEHFQANSGQQVDAYPSGKPGDDTE